MNYQRFLAELLLQVILLLSGVDDIPGNGVDVDAIVWAVAITQIF